MGEEKKTFRLSKSQYTAGIRCEKYIWLYHHDREKKAEYSEGQLARMSGGQEVGRLAHQLFPGGELIHEGYDDLAGALAHTERAVKSGKTTLYEATVLGDDILVQVDILKKNDNGRWDLYEVKSTTKLKPGEHLPDIAIQKYVLEQAGYDIENTFLVHLNNQYIRNGELDLEQLFVRQPVTKQKLKKYYDEIPYQLKFLREVLQRDKEPKVQLGSQCDNPYECPFKSYCWKDISDDSILNLTYISEKKIAKLTSLGVSLIAEIPDDFDLTENQRLQVEAAKNGEQLVDKRALQAHLGELQYPLFFLDFETINYAVPQLDGTHSYQQIPFQYSIHVQMAPGAPLDHHDYLHLDSSDPREALTQSMLDVLGDSGSIIVYFQRFEETRIHELAAALPAYRSQLEALRARLWDLEVPFSKKWHIHPEYFGRSSIKLVLPALIPDLSYDSLGVQDGTDAMLAFRKLIESEPKSAELEQLKKELLEYCKLDTFAMVRVLAYLQTNVLKKVG